MHQASINYKALMKILGAIILTIGIAMVIPWLYAVTHGDPADAYVFKLSSPPSIAIGAIMVLCFNSANAKFRTRDGYLVVALCWIVASFIGAFPYYLSEYTTNFIDAFFESAASFTTSGCSAVSGGVLSKPLLLWKALSNWLGGMGILYFVLSILPALGINGQFIANAESSGPSFEKMTVRLSDSTKLLYGIYLALTLAEFLMLVPMPQMDSFEALITAMGSISTGGVLTHPDGISHYDSVYIEIVIAFFCILSSLNFMLYYYFVNGKIKKALEDIELRAFLAILAVAIVLCTTVLYFKADYSSITSALRDSFFQVISISTTAGYVRSPYFIWPVTCQLILFALMIIGGCSGSTSGSLKVIRFVVLIKLVVRGTYKRIHPRSVTPVKLGDNLLPSQVVTGMSSFILAYIAIFIFSCIILSLQGESLTTTMGTTLAMLSNSGCAFGTAGSAGDFSLYSAPLKLYLCLLMYVGRLEIFTIMVMFTKHFWSKQR